MSFPRGAFRAFQARFDQKHHINPLLHHQFWMSVQRPVQEGKFSFVEAQVRTFRKLKKNKSVVRQWLAEDGAFHTKHVRLYPHVLKMLKQLKKRGIRLAILSDSVHSSRYKRRILRGLKVAKYFDSIFSSCEIKATKPSPKAYRFVLGKFNCRPEAAVFVGHARDELDGARRCGLRVIAYRPDNNITGYPTTKSFSNLPRMIKAAYPVDGGF